MDFAELSFAGILSMLALGGGVSSEQKQHIQQAKISTYVVPSIVGQWQLQLDNKDPNQPNCQERYNFGKNQQFTASSGQEFGFGKYLLSFDSDELPALAMRTEYDNNATDCSGKKIDQTGDMMAVYVKLDKNTMYWCRDNMGNDCPMTLYRVLP